MKILFFGTSEFAADILRYLWEKGVQIVAVVTRPDRPFGRSLRVSPPPVKELAQQLSPATPLLQPEKASTPEFAEKLKSFAPDLFVVVAYGEILKKNILEIPRLGAINVHASLLPKYRGAAPIQRCLMDGCKETGVTIMEMVLEMDAGDILEVKRCNIPEEMTAGELSTALSALAAPALLDVVGRIGEGHARRTAQNPQQVTFAPKIRPEEEQIHWSDPAHKIHNQIRALAPKPGASCFVLLGGEKKRLKIRRSQMISSLSGMAGERLSSAKDDLIIACGEGALRLLELQLEGKKTLTAGEFLRGLHASLSFLSQ